MIKSHSTTAAPQWQASNTTVPRKNSPPIAPKDPQPSRGKPNSLLIKTPGAASPTPYNRLNRSAAKGPFSRSNISWQNINACQKNRAFRTTGTLPLTV